MLIRIDGYILNLVQAFCHRWQRWTGLTNFWWARVASLGQILFAGSGICVTIGDRTIPGRYFYIGVFSFLLALSLMADLVYSWMYRRVEEHYLSGATAAHPQTLAWRSRWRDRVTLVMYPPLLLLFAGVPSAVTPRGVMVLMMFAVAALDAKQYFHSCIPLPPGVSKVRELVDGWSIRWRRVQLAPQPTA